MNLSYNDSIFSYKRRKTKIVKVGNIEIGGDNPIRIQSMTTSDTRDTTNSVKQIIDLENAGCEIVRLTVPSMPDALNLQNIKAELKKQNSKVPIVADIHFTPSVALKAVESVEKIRINPGNFADKKKFAVLEYTDKEYKLELERIFETFRPLLDRCKELGVAMRIGVNHGSLSDRIMNRYGDTPKGMVESAIEFIQMAETESYKNLVVSMKSSNPQIMVFAYRLLSARFKELKMNYPLHLGVTEAGDGKDGRIKSSVGIGSLLQDGLGDTIRVSLTEDAIREIPVAKTIIQKSVLFEADTFEDQPVYKEFRNPFQYSRFHSDAIQIGNYSAGDSTNVFIESVVDPSLNKSEIQSLIQTLTKNQGKSFSPDIFHLRANSIESLKLYSEFKKTIFSDIPFSIELTESIQFKELELQTEILNFDKLTIDLLNFPSTLKNEIFHFLETFGNKAKSIEIQISESQFNDLEKFICNPDFQKIRNILFSLKTNHLVHGYRKLAFILQNSAYPISISYKSTNKEDALYESSIGIGGLLIDGIGDGVKIEIDNSTIHKSIELSFDILQAVRLRITKTEFISCPSCGRTLFDLQDTTKRIKQKTEHLKGVKIAIMGCIVNGPGEMADADFGYVGAGPGKVHLYKGKEIVSKSIPSEIADEKLVELIKEYGMWKEP